MKAKGIKLSRVVLDPSKIYNPTEIMNTAREQGIYVCLATVYHHTKRGTLPKNWVVLNKNKIKLLTN